MTNDKPVHVVRRADEWVVLREGNKKPSSVHSTREQAEKRGRADAEKDKVEFFIHNEEASEQ